jgi:hypothetical protein
LDAPTNEDNDKDWRTEMIVDVKITAKFDPMKMTKEDQEELNKTLKAFYMRIMKIGGLVSI